MFAQKTDKDWEKFGATDPYFGVVTQDRFHSDHFDDVARQEFFATGEAHVDMIMGFVRDHLDKNFHIERGLDFGCGVARLVIPFARIAKQMVGVDVSQSVLQEAEKNCSASGVDNVEFVRSDDRLSSLKGMFNFIHSYIVFQHIPVARGEAIFQLLLDHLAPGGVGAIQFTFARQSKFADCIAWIKATIPFARNVSNVLKGRPLLAPHMQMNTYNLPRLFQILRQKDIQQTFLQFTSHGGIVGAILYFRMPD